MPKTLNSIPVFVDTSICGSRPSTLPMPRIFGGSEAIAGWPWMGSIRTSLGTHLCGVTLIDAHWAITSKGCV